jgi:gamma-glutamylcyclotransferase (GGCT)/AIG2-like uncharacterized protein YtfP
MVNQSNISFSKELRIFVYGTLKPGEVNYKLCKHQVLTAQKAN